MTTKQKKTMRDLRLAIKKADAVGELAQFRQLWREYKADGFKTDDVTKFALDDLGLWETR